ncbi:MAG TPA: hypothetical protein VK501_23915 [Baekduia sp.]|uniref:hypothetical protein n=1 Tax=Baekduia sp. TaxID=2600305 RepID=UPI002B6EA7DF|nr:hypothetical protein [Baekduia sp.]HMJ36974.1 hypothetical protein [Baekduia sp.]
MTRQPFLRSLITLGAALAVAAAVLYCLAASSTFGPNGGAEASSLPTGWWLIFGIVALCAGGLAALVIDAVFGGPRTRRPPRD